jgi:hypothetical protein
MKGFMKHVLLAVVMGALSMSNASACSCALPSLDRFVNDADQIFIATLQEARVMPGDYPERWPSITGTFHIGKSLKGTPQAGDVRLSTGLGRGDCGVSMFVSAKYVVFKQKGGAGIDACSGSSVIEDFQEDEVVKKIQAIVGQRKRKVQAAK